MNLIHHIWPPCVLCPHSSWWRVRREMRPLLFTRMSPQPEADDSLVHLTAPSSESWHRNLFFSFYCHCTCPTQMMMTHSLSDSLLDLQLHPTFTSSSLHWKRTSSHLWKNCSWNMNARNWNWCARNDLIWSMNYFSFLVSRLFVPLIFPWNVQSLS